MIPASLFVAFAFGYFLTYLFRVVNAVVGPALSAEIGIDNAGLGFLTSVYFLAFAATQLPLGILLDRFGPNRVQAALLVVAAAGAALFAVGHDLTTLTIARALIGFGVSAGLMSAFKAYSARLPTAKLPLINGLHMAVGSLGVLAGGLPVERVMQILGWRGVFVCLAVLSLMAAAGLFFGVKDAEARERQDLFRALVGGMVKILISPPFLRLAPLSVTVQAGGMALLALWVGPFLRDVAGKTSDEAAAVLSLMGVAMIVGYVLCGVVTNALVARGAKLADLMILGFLLYSATLPAIILIDPAWSAPVWLIFAVLIAVGPLSYPVLGAWFAGSLTGRVHTALNFAVFISAFFLQWGFGVVVDALAPRVGIEAAYDDALWCLVFLQAVAYVWYALKRPAPGLAAA